MNYYKRLINNIYNKKVVCQNNNFFLIKLNYMLYFFNHLYKSYNF